MFTWHELVDMGLRQKEYWLRQADAIRRQNIAMIAHGVNIGMAEKGEEAIEKLELTKTAEDSKQQRSEATWNMLYFLGGGKGV